MQDVTLSDGTTLTIKDEGRERGYYFHWRDFEGKTLGEGDLVRGQFRLVEGVMSVDVINHVMEAAKDSWHRVIVARYG